MWMHAEKNFNVHKDEKQKLFVLRQIKKKLLYVEKHTVRNKNVHNLQRTVWQEVFLLFGK
jgi:hypothetical protein